MTNEMNRRTGRIGSSLNPSMSRGGFVRTMGAGVAGLGMAAAGLGGVARAQGTLCNNVTRNDNVWTVTPSGDPSGETDHANILCAFNEATAAGLGNTVELSVGDFYLNTAVEIINFSGTFKGQGRELTRVHTAPFEVAGLYKLSALFSSVAWPWTSLFGFYYDKNWPNEQTVALKVWGFTGHIDGPSEFHDADVSDTNVTDIVDVWTHFDLFEGAEPAYRMINCSFENVGVIGKKGGFVSGWGDVSAYNCFNVDCGDINLAGGEILWKDIYAENAVTPCQSWAMSGGKITAKDIIANDCVGVAWLVYLRQGPDLSRNTIDVSNVTLKNSSELLADPTFTYFPAIYMSSARFVDVVITRLETENAPGITYAGQSATCVFSKNDIKMPPNAYIAGIVVNGAADARSTFKISHNAIASQGADWFRSPIVAFNTKNAIIANNRITGHGPSAIYVIGNFIGNVAPYSTATLIGNNVNGFIPDWAEYGVYQIWLDASSMNCVVVGQGENITNDGSNNTIMGVNNMGISRVGQDIKAATTAKENWRRKPEE